MRGSPSSAGDLEGARRRLDVRELDAPALDLRDGLLRDAHDVAVAQAARRSGRGRDQQAREIVAGAELGEAAQRR